MNKNLWIDLLLLIEFIVVSITSLALLYLPKGFREGTSYFLGISKSTWTIVHVWSGIIFILTILIHMLFHWRVYLQIFKKVKK